MPKSRHIPRFGWIGLSLLLLAAVAAPFVVPGLEHPEPIDAYLDGAFPSTLSTAWQAEPASGEETFSNVTSIVPAPGEDRLFITQKSGIIYYLDRAGTELSGKSTFMNLMDRVWRGQDSGLLSMAFHPEFNQPGSPNRGFVYVYYTAEIDGVQYIRLSRFNRPDGSNTGDKDSELILIEQSLGPLLHRGSGILFGNDGFLYLAIGDLGWIEQSQNMDERLAGGVLRIDVDQQGGAISHAPPRTLQDVGQGFSGHYYIPSDNPFVDGSGDHFEEYYALGARNPHKMTIDRTTGAMYIGDVGSNSGDIREEVNVLAPAANFGWPFREGDIDRPDIALPPDVLTGTLTDPILNYPHTDGNNCVIGGFVYRGSEYPELQGQYLYGDFGGKRVWAIDPASPEASTELFLYGPGSLVTFGEDQNGEIYLGGMGTNPIYRLTLGSTGESDPPALLSQTGAFDDLTSLTPAEGVIPYTVNTPLWSDGAGKMRWIALPNDGTHNTSAEQIDFSEEDDWRFPPGTVFIKHFEMHMDEADPDDIRRLETRFMIQDEEGAYYALTYRWLPDGSDAELLSGSFQDELTIQLADGGTRTQTWDYPSRSACFVCHTEAAGRILGPKTRQLNGDLLYPSSGITANQLETFNHLNMLSPAISVNDLPDFLTSIPLAQDDTTREIRIRSYLDANCSGCHRPEGGTRALFDARLNTPLDEAGLINGDVVEDLGISGAKILVPGSPEQSILYQRLNEAGTSTAMPPLAKQLVDEDAVQLLHDWIIALGQGLPVELRSFEGRVDQAHVYLTWTTASELNNAGFTIERRDDAGRFVEIGFVEGHGTTDEAQTYQFSEPIPSIPAPSFAYRLKQVDFDGTFAFSDVISIAAPIIERAVLHENYPNPFNPSTTIRFELPLDGPVQLQVFDLQGRLVQTLVDGQMDAGRHEVRFEALDLASGVYLYRLKVGAVVQTKSMLLVK